MVRALLACFAWATLLSCSPFVDTKSAAEMRVIQENGGLWALGQSIYYAGSTRDYHYLAQHDVLRGLDKDDIDNTWHFYRVSRSELELEPGMEAPYDSSAKHGEDTMRYAKIMPGPPYVLKKHATLAEKADKYRQEALQAQETLRQAREDAAKPAVPLPKPPPPELPIPPPPEASKAHPTGTPSQG